ncbi:MAG: response regulator transcription factor [Anaerolineae bacterium]
MRALVVDDNPVIREGLIGVLEGSTVEVAAGCGSAAEALRALRSQAVDVVFVGGRVAALDSFAVIAEFKRVSPQTGVVVIDVGAGTECLLPAIQHGASAFLSAHINREALLLAAEAVAQGYVMADAALVRHVLPRAQGVAPEAAEAEPPLSPREWEVLALIGEGLNNREIAARLHITVGTVRSHVASILEKLRVKGRVQAALWARRHGL